MKRLLYNAGVKISSPKVSAAGQIQENPGNRNRHFLFNIEHTQSYNRNSAAAQGNRNAAANLTAIDLSHSLSSRQKVTDPTQVRNHSASDTACIRSKKGQAVESYFRDRRFTGAPKQSLDSMI